ncbi:hypothetical protein G9F32_03155 [Acinetobacter sp. 194]|uniref:hypothetical protein n=1 Tax=Acinetobacter shaoyimingii TaxID=2715164 RepID=UPI001407512A|nr:hypothetical protein [Acinetobacter shaoyimingii]NHB57031.1 hypothetical protein [Acinetobacter shaoyimingii]
MATASLGRLTLDMVVRLGNFTEGLDRAGRESNRAGREIERGVNVGSLAIKALGAAAAGLSITAISDFAFQTIDAGNEIKKFSQLANTTMRDFQYYSKGAQTAGIEIESFADKMKDMQDRIGDFQQSGGGPLADFFENIAPLVGVTIQQFQKLSGPEALQLYYDSLVKVGASQNDMKFYMEAIISDSSLLIPLLQNNGEGFKKWGDQAERTGAILSDDVVNSLTKAKENLQILDLHFEGFKNTLVENVVPAVEYVAENMDTVKAIAVALSAAIGSKLVVQAGILAGTFTMAAIRAGVMEATLISLQGGAARTATAMGVLRGAMAFLGGPAGLAMLAIQGVAAGAAFLYMKKTSDDVEPALSKQCKTIAELTTEYDKLSEAQQRAFKYQETVELKNLTESYSKAEQQVRAYASGIADVAAKDEATREAIKGWIREFDNQKLSAEQLANKINSLNGVSEDYKVNMDKHAIASTHAKAAMDAQQKVVNSLTTSNRNLANTHNQVTGAVNQQAQAYLSLNQKQREALKSINDEVARAQYIDKNVGLGWSKERADYYADYRKEAGLGYSKALTNEELKQLEVGYKVQEQNKSREESEKKIEEAKKKQVDSQKKLNDLVGASALSGLRIKSGESVAGGKVRGYTAEFAQLAQQSLGSTLNRFTAFNDSYHKGTNSKHATGNAFDFTVNNAKEAAAAVKQLNDIAKRYGFTIKAINEYSDPSKRSTGGHVHVSVLGYSGREDAISDAKAEVNLVRDSINELEEIRKQTLERQKTVQQTYFTEEQQMTEDHNEKIKAIELAFAGDESAIKKYTELENAAFEKSVAQYKQSLNQKTLDEKKQLLEVKKNWVSAEEYARQYYELVREEILNTAEYSPEMKDILIRKANSDQGIAENAERESVWGDYQSRFGVQKSPYQQDMELLAEARKQMLITEDDYQRQRLDLQLSYGAQYGADFAGLMMGLVDSSSSAYALLGAAQKSFALFSVMMDGKVAVAKAWASAAFPYNMPAVGTALVQTGILQAAVEALTPAKYATGGHITGKGTGTSDEIPIWASNGEFMMRTAAVNALGLDTLNFMNQTGRLPNKYATGGLIALDKPKVTNTSSDIVSKYVNQARENSASQRSTIDNKLSVIMVKDDDEAKNYKYSKDFENAVLYHMKRNRSKV